MTVTDVPLMPQSDPGSRAFNGFGTTDMLWRSIVRLRIGGAAAMVLRGLAIAVLVVPGSLLAAVSPAETAAGLRAGPELQRLQTMREQLVRRRALQSSLERRIEALGGELEALGSRREQTSAALQQGRAEVAMIERQLDHLVPRVLARSAAVRERREQVGRLLGDLASSSRQVELDQTVRARLLAISPVMLRRLRGAEARLAILQQQPESALARQAEIEDRMPALAAEAQRLQAQGEQTARQRQATEARLETLMTEVAGLAREQRLLSRRLLTDEAAHMALAGGRVDQPALPDRVRPAVGMAPVDATVRGALPERLEIGLATGARQPAAPQLIAAAPESLDLSHSLATAQLEVPALPPPPAEPVTVAVKNDRAAAPAHLGDYPGATALDVVFLEPASLADVGSRVAPARLGRVQAPLVPVPGAAVNPFSDAAGVGANSDITIAAAPGQAVAAPEAGRVVFAGTFRSYGKLLIIEHQREYHTLLWGFSALDVAEGDRVQTGQVVGVMADDAGGSPELHVELRHNGRPVNSLPWLAASSNKVRG
jgi:murein hydrolase activator